MAKPILKQITPFDATKDSVISFVWSGSRAYSNRIIIYENYSLEKVFDDTIATYKFEHTIPANTLSNGIKYIIECQVMDQDGTASALSNKVSFTTIATPDFHFSNIPQNGNLNMSSFGANIYYYSSDGEDLSCYKFYLYDANKKLLLETKAYYNVDNVTYNYRGFENDAAYYIRCMGITVNGIELDTGYERITVKYENQNTYARVYAENVPKQGCIKISSNIVIIQYNGTDEFTYIDGMIDLRDKMIYYDSGFEINGDFSVIIRGMYLWHTGDVFKMRNGQYEITLSSRIYTDGTLRYKLEVPNGTNTYIRYSEPLVFDDEDMITIGIRRINDLYQLVAFIELGFSRRGNIWWGSNRPVSNTENYDNWIDTNDSPIYKSDKDIIKTITYMFEPDTANKDDIWLGGE